MWAWGVLDFSSVTEVKAESKYSTSKAVKYYFPVHFTDKFYNNNNPVLFSDVDVNFYKKYYGTIDMSVDFVIIKKGKIY